MTAAARGATTGATPAPASLGRTALRGGAIALLGNGATYGLALATNVVLARELSPEDYGVFGMMATVAGLARMVNDLGLTSATVQRRELTEAQSSTVFWLNLAVSSGIGVALAGASPLVGSAFGDARVGHATAAVALSFVFSGLGAQHVARLRRQLRFGVLAANSVASTFAGVVVGVWLATRGAGYWALVVQQLVQAAVGTLGVWVASGWRPGPPRRRIGVGAMIRYGAHLTGFNFINYVARNVDNALIGGVWGAGALGIYGRAYALLLLPLSQINAPLANVALPTLSRLHDQPDAYRRAYLRAVEKVALVTLPGVAFLTVCSDWVVAVVLGPKWAPVADTFRILGFAGLVQPIVNTVGWLYTSQARTREMLYAGSINAAISIAAILAGLPGGGNGVALAYVLTTPLQTFIAFHFAGRTGPVSRSDLWKLLGTFTSVAALVVLALVVLRRLATFEGPLSGIAAGAAVTLLATLVGLAASRRGRAALADFVASIGKLTHTGS